MATAQRVRQLSDPGESQTYGKVGLRRTRAGETPAACRPDA